MLGFARRIPARPAPNAEFNEAYHQANERLKEAGKIGSVLVRLDIDSEGRVVSSRAIQPPWITRFGEWKVVLVDAETGKHLSEPPPRSDDPEIRHVAAEIAQLLRFTPAMRGRRPVAHRGYRTTISFA